MQIQSVGKAQTAVKPQTTDKASGIDSEIKAINSQIEVLQKQIQDLQKQNKNSGSASQSSQNSKAVQDQVKEIQTEITQLKQEIAKLQSEKYTNNDSQNNQNSKEETIDDKLVKCGNNINDLKTQYSTKKKLQGSANVLKSEIELDKARGLDTTKKEEKLNNMNKSLEKLDKDLGKSVSESVKNGNSKVVTEEDKQEENDPDKYTDEELKSNFIDERA